MSLTSYRAAPPRDKSRLGMPSRREPQGGSLEKCYDSPLGNAKVQETLRFVHGAFGTGAKLDAQSIVLARKT